MLRSGAGAEQVQDALLSDRKPGKVTFRVKVSGIDTMEMYKHRKNLGNNTSMTAQCVFIDNCVCTLIFVPYCTFTRRWRATGTDAGKLILK